MTKRTKKTVKSSNRRRSVPAARTRSDLPVRGRKQTGLGIRNVYEAAGSGRRLKMWQPGQLGPNAAVLRDLELLRRRSRDSTRNNVWISQGIRSLVSNEIGTGITPLSQASDKNFRKEADKLWTRWAKVADADGNLDFNGLLSLASRTRIEAGEIFIRIRPRNLNNGLPVPFQLQLLEPEFVPISRNVLNAQRTVRAGIEFNGLGARTAYWMYRSHPGDSFFGLASVQIVPVPAKTVIHHFAPLRPGQIRGLPWTVQALIKSKDFDEYDDAELIRKKNRSSYTGAITRQNYGEDDYKFDPFTGEPINRDANDVPMMNVESGSMFSLLPGESVNMFDGDATGGGYADFVRQQLLGVAAGLGIPYEFLTGDMSKVNDRLMRVILNEFHRIIEQTQWHIIIPQICDRVWTHFIDMAVLAGALEAPGYEQNRQDFIAVEWRPDGWPYIHPLQDVQAKRLAVRSGFESRSAVVAERGWNAEDVDRQNSEDKKRAEKLGLKYETDPEPEGSNPQVPDDPDDTGRRGDGSQA